MDLGRINEFALEMIFDAGKYIRASFSQELIIETKSDFKDIVTNIDREIEQFFVNKIKMRDPSHKILGEEGMGDNIVTLDGPVWIIDPIDGTMNFVKQHRHFLISIGFYVDGEGKLGYLYDVMRNEIIYAIRGEGAFIDHRRIRKLMPLTIEEAVIGINASWVIPNDKINHEKMIQLIKKVRGTRSYGSAAMEISLVVTGKLDAYLSMRLAPWDVGGGMVIAEEVGAVTSNLKGKPFNLLTHDTFLIANPSIHKILLDQFIELK
ncbi:MAG: inositol monophosphatase family protein [Lysinibacillus sp.]|nr:inositol monophosphatase family protein [Lysinibacillus sp.]